MSTLLHFCATAYVEWFAYSVTHSRCLDPSKCINNGLLSQITVRNSSRTQENQNKLSPTIAAAFYLRNLWIVVGMHLCIQTSCVLPLCCRVGNLVLNGNCFLGVVESCALWLTRNKNYIRMEFTNLMAEIDMRLREPLTNRNSRQWKMHRTLPR